MRGRREETTNKGGEAQRGEGTGGGCRIGFFTASVEKLTFMQTRRSGFSYRKKEDRKTDRGHKHTHTRYKQEA